MRFFFAETYICSNETELNVLLQCKNVWNKNFHSFSRGEEFFLWWTRKKVRELRAVVFFCFFALLFWSTVPKIKYKKKKICLNEQQNRYHMMNFALFRFFFSALPLISLQLAVVVVVVVYFRNSIFCCICVAVPTFCCFGNICAITENYAHKV